MHHSKTRPARISTKTAFALAGGGTAAIMALVPLTAVAGQWWLLGAAFATLLATAGLVVLGIFGLLAQTGDPLADGRAPATKRAMPAGKRPAAKRGLGAPALGRL